jgi:Family of unknown function (DUF6011)
MSQRKRPPVPQGDQRPSKHRANGYHHNSGDYRHQAPTADERHEIRLLEELRRLGYCIAVSCVVCGHPLTSARSVALMVGPRCRAKAAAA